MALASHALMMPGQEVDMFDAFDELEKRRKGRARAQHVYRELRRSDIAREEASRLTRLIAPVRPVSEQDVRAELDGMWARYVEMRDTWENESHMWACGIQDGFGDSMDELRQAIVEETQVLLEAINDAAFQRRVYQNKLADWEMERFWERRH